MEDNHSDYIKARNYSIGQWQHEQEVAHLIPRQELYRNQDGSLTRSPRPPLREAQVNAQKLQAKCDKFFASNLKRKGR